MPKRKNPNVATVSKPKARNKQADETRRSNGDGSVSRTKSGNFQARYTDSDGKRKTIGTYPTWAAANAALEAHADDVRAGRTATGRAKNWTLLQAFDYWVEMEPSTSGNSRRQRNDFRKGYLLGETDAAIRKGRRGIGCWVVADVERHQVSQWNAALKAEGLADATISIQRSLLHRVYEYLIDEELFTGTNPFRSRKGKKGEKKKLVKEPHILRLDEIIAMTLACQPYYGLLMETQFWSGARSGESRALHGAAIDLDEGALRITKALTAEDSNQPEFGPTKTWAGRRTPTTPRRILSALEARAEEVDYRADAPLFVRIRKKTMMTENDLGAQFRNARKSAGLLGDLSQRDPLEGRWRPPTAHDARKTGISLLYALGASRPEILAWAGHTDEETTLTHYARPIQADPVVSFVKSLGLPLGEAWNVLYEMAWLVYGDPEFAPDYSVLQPKVAARFTTWLDFPDDDEDNEQA